ncbi:MAG: YqaJ viral recombinase family protein [Candidatus Gracilibacteria bacterium]|jgi:putative phage-type endonuclease
MKTINFDKNKEAWMAYRHGKITGSTLADIVPKKNGDKKIGFWELVASRVADEPDWQNAMERGVELEHEAAVRFMLETDKELDTSLIMWEREDNPNIAISPDAVVIGENASVEIKCLSSARHLQAFFEQAIPSEYEHQARQYFVVNDELETLYFVFYDPRVKCKPFFFIKFAREDMEIDEYLSLEKKTLFEADEYVNRLMK